MQLKNNNGTWVLDTEFGTNGYQVINFNLGTVPTSPPVDTYTYLQDITLQNDGKVLLYSYVYYNTVYYLTVSRLLKDGKVDTAFPTGGSIPGSAYMSIDPAAVPSSSNKVQFAVHPSDNSIYCTGPAIPSSGVVPVYRYSSAGVLDFGFTAQLNKSNGYYANLRSRAILIKPDGNILVGGNNGTTTKDYAMMQIKKDGFADNTFDSDGFLFLDRGYSSEETVTNIVLENSNSIVLSGKAAASTASSAPVFTALRVIDFRVELKAHDSIGGHPGN